MKDDRVYAATATSNSIEPNSRKLKPSIDEVGTAEATAFSLDGIRSYLRLQPKPTNYEQQPVIFFDLDNTLYSKNLGIWAMMGQNIQRYFQERVGLPEEESRVLRRKFYLDYGLAIRGLIRHFEIDPLEYDDFVDGSLPLDDLLHPDSQQRALLEACHGRRWIFTNAGMKHAMRCLRLLNIEDCFEGVIFCDYTEADFPAKPDRLAYERAQFIAEQPDPRLCFFIDDSAMNVRMAKEVGWQAILLDELEAVNGGSDGHAAFHTNELQEEERIEHIEQMRQVFPQLFPPPE